MTNTTHFCVRLTVPQAHVALIESFFEAEALAISDFENKADATLRDMELLLGDAPDLAVLASDLAAQIGGAVPQMTMTRVEQVNWLEHAYQGFAPIQAGRFTIRSDYGDADARPDRLTLWIEAATAFGTGEHATTYGCLVAFSDEIKRGLNPGPILDMGCGSGILAIAASKALKRPVLAADIDPEAVRVTRRHAIRNGEQARLRACVADGFGTRDISSVGPFQLIFANILAGPLCEMAHDMRRALTPGGIAILSGLLTEQEQMVLGAMRAGGLVLQRRLRVGEWSTLVVRR